MYLQAYFVYSITVIKHIDHSNIYIYIFIICIITCLYVFPVLALTVVGSWGAASLVYMLCTDGPPSGAPLWRTQSSCPAHLTLPAEPSHCTLLPSISNIIDLVSGLCACLYSISVSLLQCSGLAVTVFPPLALCSCMRSLPGLLPCLPPDSCMARIITFLTPSVKKIFLVIKILLLHRA